MLALARDRCLDCPWIRFEHADVVALWSGADTFDAATSTQVYEYVQDIPMALAELFRILRPGGRAVIIDTDYDSWVVRNRSEERFAKIRG